MACGTTKQSHRTFHLHFLTCLGPTFCSINSGKVIVRCLWHWHKKDTGDSCLHHHFMFSKKFTIFKVFPSWKNWEFTHHFPVSDVFFSCHFFDRLEDALDHYVSTCGGTKVGFFVGFSPVKWGHIPCWWCFTNSTMVIVNHHQTTIWDNIFSFFHASECKSLDIDIS